MSERLEVQRRILRADDPREQAVRELVKFGLDEEGVRRCFDALDAAGRLARELEADFGRLIEEARRSDG